MSPKSGAVGHLQVSLSSLNHLRCFAWLCRSIDERLAIFAIAEEFLTFDI